MSFDTLPIELYESIFGFILPVDLRPTVLAVSRAIPLSPVPLHHLYHQIRVQHPDQIIRLYTRLSRAHKNREESEINTSQAYSYLDQMASWINEISIESWVADAEVVINLFRLLRRSELFRLQSLNVWIGPSNFAPEHLEELLTEPLLRLEYLSLRFRPYVQKATYQQFLKGTYFDSTLKAIASWPSAIFPALSIIQDPIDATTAAEKRSFAQPLVFFRLDIASFMRSPALSSVTSLRFRIPARPVARALCSAPPPPNPSHNAPLPDLEFLDLSSSAILENEIDMLLVRLPLLQHVILDGCSIFRGEIDTSDWRTLGKRCALIGVQRAREREKALKEWFELRDASRLMSDMTIAGTDANESRKIKPGRRGLATATISFRAPEPVASTSAFRPTLPPATTPAVIPTPSPVAKTPQIIKNEPTSSTSQASSTKVTPSKPIPSLVSATLQDIQSHLDKRNKKKKKSGLPAVPTSFGPQNSSPAVPAESSLPLHPVSVPSLHDSSQDEKVVSEDPQPPIKGKHKAKEKKGGARTKKRAGPRKIRVLPSLPSLVSLSVTLPSATVERVAYSDIRDQFEEGWAEGVTQLEGARARLRTSAGNGVRVMNLATGPLSKEIYSSRSGSETGSGEGSGGGSETSTGRKWGRDGLEGLVDVDRTDPDAFGTFKEGSVSLAAPILCFAGPSRDGQHVDNCGHSVAWKVMKDDK